MTVLAACKGVVSWPRRKQITAAVAIPSPNKGHFPDCALRGPTWPEGAKEAGYVALMTHQLTLRAVVSEREILAIIVSN